MIIEKKELEKAIQKTINRASERYCGTDGKCQLFGVLKGQEIRDFEIADSDNEQIYDGKNVVFLYEKEWFDPIKGWNMDVEMVDEINNDNSLLLAYIQAFNEKYPNRDVVYNYLMFNELLPEKCKEVMLKRIGFYNYLETWDVMKDIYAFIKCEVQIKE
ncbi:hypothetical protein M5X00_23290 [Paenibacillus alvei]|uniref:Phage protein n=1 Tax=Paenibacillus alvei TaxID=44250 RepID=A0ABT4H7L9_PAEAL|nr:hypothetical protein [Paenibacillus alvei]EJW14331.1 hypothetical protein PAV_14c00240 [Paenibacillus alvei DSM 29]MCY9543974.1 hypothetical protein [Paenibacillus alvei]MCY9737297.1 hypothetical protein [Paenibacillus alvei]MCY9757167.1 hypothetical protein [Paenibacillus alvei]MCY9764960.1 hypothetical protein [Paenibacillus alvei]